MLKYNILKGKNTVLRGLIAEETAAYLLRRNTRLVIFRPTEVLSFLEKANVHTSRQQFIKNYQQTMDYFGLFTSQHFPEQLNVSSNELVYSFFTHKEDLRSHLERNKIIRGELLKGYAIEIKSRVKQLSRNEGSPSFSEKQLEMISVIKKNRSFKLLLVKVSFSNNWTLYIDFFDENNKRIEITKIFS